MYVFKGTIFQRESSVSQLHDDLRALQTVTNSIQVTVVAGADAGVSVAGLMKELERICLSAEKDLLAVQAERCTVRGKESPPLNICQTLERQVAVLLTELQGSKAKLEDLTLQHDGTRVRRSTSSSEHDTAAAHECTAIGNMRPAEVGRDALSREFTMAKHWASGVQAAIMNLHTEVDDFLGASNLYRFTTWSAVYSPFGTFILTLYETCSENLVSVRGDNDHNVESNMIAVLEQHFRLCVSSMRRARGVKYLP